VSMSSAAQRNELPDADSYPATGTEGPNALKTAVAERLAEHRHRRASERAQEEASETRARMSAEAAYKQARSGASKVREAVQARYQQSQSYREFLAAEAERALQQAQAEAEVAARNADAVADAQAKLMQEIAQWEQQPAAKAEVRSELAHELADIVLGAKELIAERPLLTIVETAEPQTAPSLTVRMYEQLHPAHEQRSNSRQPSVAESTAAEEIEELEQEIAFRQAPAFTEHTIESQPIPANIIEFPRQLVAPRKARPRLAEGPLLEESLPEPQLRIFEVEAEQIAIEPEYAPEPSGAPEWQSLLLESDTLAQHVAPAEAQAHYTFEPQAAAVHLRLMATAVDGLCVLTGFLAFATVVGYLAGPRLLALSLPLLGGGTVATLALFYLAFQMLFFSFSDATPGMRYARIALCTFGDDNPTRKAMRLRTLATVLALCPLGIGLAWMWMDDDRLGWHDRISRMYQRAY
jgi:uncharacterized RDD family membrane protein YckC